MRAQVETITPAKEEILRGQHAAGLKADMMLKAFGDLHHEREQQGLKELLDWFITQPWDERTAIRYIAKLSENRSQKEELELRARKGVSARAALFGNQNDR